MASGKTEPRYSAVLPILNKGCSLPGTVPLPLSPDVSFRKIRGDDLAVITEEDDDAFGLIKGGTFTLTIDSFDPEMPFPEIQSKITAALFSLNVLGNGTPASIDKAYVIRSLRKHSIHKIYHIPGHHHGNTEKFEVTKGTDLSYGANIFNAVLKALVQHPPLRITISRFSSAIGRSSQDDKLIDLCIALESIFQAQTEISFQFALYNSILSESDPAKRASIFQTLKRLYKERSNIVHGNKDLDVEWAKDRWDDLLLIAKSAILRKVEFLSENNQNSWKDYLEQLALGIGNGD